MNSVATASSTANKCWCERPEGGPLGMAGDYAHASHYLVSLLHGQWQLIHRRLMCRVCLGIWTGATLDRLFGNLDRRQVTSPMLSDSARSIFGSR